jgi:hypothetical protein
MMLKEMRAKKKQLPHSVSAGKEKHTKNTKTLFWGKGRHLFGDFCFSQGVVKPKPGGKRRTSAR